MEKTKKEKSDKQINYEEAMGTVERNINSIYIDCVIEIIMVDIRIRLKIDDNMYYTLQDESDKIDKIQNMHELIRYLTNEWIKRGFKNKIDKRIITKHIAKEEVTRELINTKTSEAEIEQIADNISENITDEYLKRQIETYQLSDSFVIFPTRVNLKIWKSVVDAKLFNVPIEKILECKKSIMEKNYLPIVNMSNGNLYISINELTTQNDLILVWDEIKKKQKEYKDKYNYLDSGRRCKNAKIDRILLKLNNKGLKPKKISDILYNDYNIELTADKVSERLKEIKKRARNSLKNNLLLSCGE